MDSTFYSLKLLLHITNVNLTIQDMVNELIKLKLE